MISIGFIKAPSVHGKVTLRSFNECKRWPLTIFVTGQDRQAAYQTIAEILKPWFVLVFLIVF